MKHDTLYSIEMFRGIAAVLVVILHSSSYYSQVFGEHPFGSIVLFMHSGVEFFFVLSGFIILTIHNKDIGIVLTIPAFLVKRFTRVFPFYWVCLFIFYGLTYIVPHYHFPDTINLVKDLALYPNRAEASLFVSWTLQHEIIFYLLFTIVLFNRLLGAVVLSLWFSVVVVLNFVLDVPELYPEWYMSSDYNIAFFLGIFAARVLKRYSFEKSCRMILVFGIVLFMAGAIFEINPEIYNISKKFTRLCYSCASFFMIVGAVSTERYHRIHIPKLGKILGKASYGIYLAHMFFVWVIFTMFKTVGIFEIIPHSVSCSVLVVISIWFSVKLSQMIELPISNFFRQKCLNLLK